MALPITKEQAYTAARWMKSNFSPSITSAVEGSPFSADLICAIACQETAYFWLSFIKELPAEEVLKRCVLDASGDFPNTKRSAFPRNTAAFRDKYGDEVTSQLIEEANLTRKLRGFKPEQWVYKGYGIFQYDLQYIKDDGDFFLKRQWYDFQYCLDRALLELKRKYARTNDLWAAVKAYNGSGSSATAYANNVMQYAQYCSEIDF